MQRARQGSRQLRAQPVQRVRQPPRPLRRSPVARWATCSRPSARASGRDLRLAAFTSATGSAGTIAAGDRLKDEYGTKIVAVEALECPTMLENGYGEHNIQGIGDKHIPLIHNVMNTDVVCAISDAATDELDVLWNTEQGRAYLARAKGIDAGTIAALAHFGFSSTCNVLAAIKTAKLLDLGPDDALITVATDGGAMYSSERVKTIAAALPRRVQPHRRRRGVRPTPRARLDRAHDRAARGRPAADLQPRLLHVGRAAGHAVRAVRAAPSPGLLARAAPLRRRVGRDDRPSSTPGWPPRDGARLTHSVRAMSGRDPNDEHRVATSLELLFDLTFVIAFSVAGSEFAHLDRRGSLPQSA